MAFLARPARASVSIVTARVLDYPDEMSDQDIERFRAQADECRAQAERAMNPLDKERWLRLAGDWIKMAQDAEKRLGKQ
jgi:hypothetical protein